MNLGGVDLNLLVAFDALMSEQSVTRAGQKIGLSQPAMSGALARLRLILNDELFLRRGDRMRPTARAIEIAEPIRKALDQIQTALAEKRYEPKRSSRTFRIACNDLGTAVFIPPLIEKLATLAPNVSVEVHHADSARAVELLERDEVDLAAGHHPDRLANIATATLFFAPYACAIRVDHPLAGKTVDLPQLAGLPHIVVAHPGDPGRNVDQILGRYGMSRRIALQVPHYLVVPHLLCRTDFVAFVPRKIVQQFRGLTELRVADPDIAKLHAHAVLFWSNVKAADDANRWLRSIIVDIAKEGRIEDWIADPSPQPMPSVA